MSDKKIPKPEDIQKEFEDFIQKRFGKSVQVFAQEFEGLSYTLLLLEVFFIFFNNLQINIL